MELPLVLNRSPSSNWPVPQNLNQLVRESQVLASGQEILISNSRQKRHTPQQIIEKPREGDALLNAGQSVAQVFQHLEIGEASEARFKKTERGLFTTNV